MKTKKSKLTFSERIQIETLINKRYPQANIARILARSRSTISREIKSKRQFVPSNNMFCVNLHDCKVCKGRCNHYKDSGCEQRDKTIGACNGCPKKRKCHMDKYVYSSKKAQSQYEYTLRDSRQGVNLTTSELFEMAEIVCPLLKNGQTPYMILENHPEINISITTFYKYISMNLFENYGLTPFTLKRKLSRKVTKTKKKKLLKRSKTVDTVNRTYDDYIKFKEEHPDLPTTEMDTVYNFQAGPFIQTYIVENTGFMFGILHPNKTSAEMVKGLDYIEERLAREEFKSVFSLILTDRGTEFTSANKFEVNQKTMVKRTNLFYCDPMCSWQKPHVENGHINLREILPKGVDWKNLTQEKINLIFSHINSSPRKALGGKTAYEVFSYMYGEDIPKKLGIKKINKDDIILNPSLLKK